MENQYYYVLGLASNPLQKLPQTVGNTTYLMRVYATNTEVRSYPEWLSPESETGLFAAGTPLCARYRSNYYQPPPNLICEPGGRNMPYIYPLEIEEEWRALSTQAILNEL